MRTGAIDVLAFAVMVGGDVYELETSAENAQQEAQRTGGRVVELIDRAAVAELIEVAKFAELLKFKQSSKNANAAFLDYRDCVHLQTIARGALARIGVTP